ncbi:MAG: YraN family protein [Zetaproteobacteria bacterium]|nr:YraN family protein [Zetaproteobacteria bacterium]
MSTVKGQAGEVLAAEYLLSRGYRVVARNVRLARGEIDLIVEKDDLLVIVEVKSYQQRLGALLAVGAQKQQRIISATKAYLCHHPEKVSLQCRFDLIILTPDKKQPSGYAVEHFDDAFRCF